MKITVSLYQKLEKNKQTNKQTKKQKYTQKTQIAALISYYSCFQRLKKSLHTKKLIVSSGNRIQVNRLEGSYAHHYTTDATRESGTLKPENIPLFAARKWRLEASQ